MADSMTWVIKHGEAGTTRTGTLLENGSPIDLTTKTVTMNARRTTASPRVLSDVSITPDPDQVTNPGEITWTVLSAHSNPDNVPKNLDGYLIEFKLVDGSVIDYVPKKKSVQSSYGRLVVHENLD